MWTPPYVNWQITAISLKPIHFLLIKSICTFELETPQPTWPYSAAAISESKPYFKTALAVPGSASAITSHSDRKSPLCDRSLLQPLQPFTGKVIIYKLGGELFFLKQKLRFGLVLVRLLKNSAILIKCPTFAGVFSSFKGKAKVSVHCSVCTKKLINIKVGKMYIFALKCTFWRQNKLWISACARADLSCQVAKKYLTS